jgi:hypothetical protein
VNFNIRKAIAQYPTMKFDYKEIANGYLAEFSYESQKTTLRPLLKTKKRIERVGPDKGSYWKVL